MSYYQRPDSHIRDKVKVELDSLNYATKTLDHVQALIHLIQLLKNTFKPEVDKLDINKLTNFRSSLNNLKTKVDNLDVDK